MIMIIRRRRRIAFHFPHVLLAASILKLSGLSTQTVAQWVKPQLRSSAMPTFDNNNKEKNNDK